MSDKEKNAISELAKVFDKLPKGKQQYFNGYADGVADVELIRDLLHASALDCSRSGGTFLNSEMIISGKRLAQKAHAFVANCDWS